MQYIAIFNGNPTANARDGAEVSQGDVLSNPVKASVSAGSDAVVKCAVRCASGLSCDSASIDVITKANGSYTIGSDYAKVSESASGPWTNTISIADVSDVNSIFYVKLTGLPVAGSYTAYGLRLSGVVE